MKTPRQVLGGLVALAATLLCSAVLAAPASAAPAPRPAARVTVLTVPMAFDTLTAAPNSRVSGSCGVSYIYIYNDGGGVAQLNWGFQSSIGWVVAYTLRVNWTNWSTGGGGGFPDIGAMNGPTHSGEAYQGTKPGYVTTSVGGVVLLTSGAICTLLTPSDAVTVT